MMKKKKLNPFTVIRQLGLYETRLIVSYSSKFYTEYSEKMLIDE